MNCPLADFLIITIILIIMELNYSRILKSTFILMIIYMLVYPGDITAQPHVFIDSSMVIVFDEQGMAGIKVKWVFDLMFSDTMIHDFDKDKNGKFNKAEIKDLNKESFSNLKEFNYFTFMFIDKREFKVKYIKDFSADIQKKQLVFAFFIACHVKAVSSYKEIKIAMFDKTIYTDFALLEKDTVKFENASHFDFNYEILDNRENSYYGSENFPQEIILRFRKKK